MVLCQRRLALIQQLVRSTITKQIVLLLPQALQAVLFYPLPALPLPVPVVHLQVAVQFLQHVVEVD